MEQFQWDLLESVRQMKARNAARITGGKFSPAAEAPAMEDEISGYFRRSRLSLAFLKHQNEESAMVDELRR
nr:hypothetical protein [Pseudomonas sp. SWRI111]